MEAVIGPYVNITRAATLGGKLYAVSVMRLGDGSTSNRNAFFNSFEIRAAR